MTRTRLLAASAALLLVLAGCTGVPGGTDGQPTTDTTTTTATTTTATMTTDTTTTTSTTTTTDEPEKGDDLLQVDAIDNETAMEFPPGKRATYGNLTEAQQRVFEEALECDCSVDQEVFDFNDKDRIEAVYYDGQWYYLRVLAV